MKALISMVLGAAVTLTMLPSAAAAESEPRAGRVLVLSLPTLSWDEVNEADLPNLDALLDESAIGSFSHRAVDRRTTPGDGYATMSAGTKADGDEDVDGLGFGVDETYLGEPAVEIFTRRTGVEVDGGLFTLAQPVLATHDDLVDFDAEIGALGDALVEGGAHPAVIANADGSSEQPDAAYSRQAVLGLAGTEGTVPGGRVDDGLLESDLNAPYGHRLDRGEVMAAFDEAWVDRAVVLVEGSDLVRADTYRPLATSAQADMQERQALERTDALIGDLLDRVDPATDAVLVVGPFPSTGSDELTLSALRAPGVEPGLLKTAVTRRSGFVTAVDVAPTILGLLGIELPDTMDGRRFEPTSSGLSAQERRDWLADVNDAAIWRDAMLVPVATAFVVAQLVLWIVAVRALGRGAARARKAVEIASLAVIAVLPLSYLASLLPFHRWGAPAYWAFLVVGGAVIGALAQTCLRRWPADPLMAVLALTCGLLLIDSVVADRVQLNAVFGYTPTLAGRFAGICNMAFAQMAAAAIILAGLLASRIGGRRGAYAALGLLSAVLVIDASPFWGSDVGGALTLVPVVAGMASVLLDIRFRLRTWLLVGVGTIVVLLVAGFVDLARPPESRSHLGRLFEDIGNNGMEAFVSVVVRKAGAIVAVLDTSVWTLMLPVVFGFVLYLIWRAPWRLRRLAEVLPAERAARVGFVIAAVLGFALNDSGITVPGLMLGVMNASLVYLILRTEDPPWKAEIDEADRPDAVQGEQSVLR